LGKGDGKGLRRKEVPGKAENDRSRAKRSTRKEVHRRGRKDMNSSSGRGAGKAGGKSNGKNREEGEGRFPRFERKEVSSRGGKERKRERYGNENVETWRREEKGHFQEEGARGKGKATIRRVWRCKESGCCSFVPLRKGKDLKQEAGRTDGVERKKKPSSLKRKRETSPKERASIKA